MNDRPSEAAAEAQVVKATALTLGPPARPRSEAEAAFFDKCKQRQVPGVPEPARHRLHDDELFIQASSGLLPNTNLLRDHLFREGKLHQHQALRIVREATEVFSLEKNLLELDGPITICGDIHGQFYDLPKIFELGGDPASNSYLFLGDYVDRGSFGIECLLYLYSLKVRYPKRIHLLRGNHECRHLTQHFTFHRECVRKYSTEVYEACITSFCALPLAALLDKHFFCVHGGISPELNILDDINRINRFQEPPSYGLLCDLLWSDPAVNFGTEHAQPHRDDAIPIDEEIVIPPADALFVHNPVRGCSFNYTYDAVCAFLERNNLFSIIRGHEVQPEGYKMSINSPHKNCPAVITIFSAPNYCGFYRNRAAVIKYRERNVTIRQFIWSSQPYWLPNFIDGFTWSLPFMGEKIIQMLQAILACCTLEELQELSEEETAVDGEGRATTRGAEMLSNARRQSIKNKVLAVSRMRRVYQILREEAELASELDIPERSVNARSMTVDPNELGVRTSKVEGAIHSYDDARRSDEANEHIPSSPPSRPHSPIVHHNPESSPTSFPVIQAPSTRASSRTRVNEKEDIEEHFRRVLHLEKEEVSRANTNHSHR